jgi:polysaccharide biosynthesis/export protein
MSVIRAALPSKSVVVVLLLVVGTAGISRSEQADQTPPKELVQYVLEAKRQGLAESKIKKQAVAVGWTAAAVDEAIAYAKSGKPLPASPAAPAAITSMPQNVPPVSNSFAPVEQTTPTAAVPDKPAVPSSAGATAAQGVGDDYVIGSGDTLQITVWKEPELSVPTVVVRPDGKITVPLIKEVKVAGLTPRQAEALIVAGIEKFYTDPNVTVVVALPTSKKIYLIGAVQKQGILPYTYGMTVLQALSEAGGLTDYAKKTKIYVLRTENGREYRLDFNYKEAIRGERADQNYVLLPGDTVVVPQ